MSSKIIDNNLLTFLPLILINISRHLVSDIVNNITDDQIHKNLKKSFQFER